MSRNPAKKIIAAPVRKFPTAKLAAAPKFTTSPKKVSRLGLIPVAASAPTMRSSSHFPPVPIAPVNVPMVFTIGHDTAIVELIQMQRTPGCAGQASRMQDAFKAYLTLQLIHACLYTTLDGSLSNP